jgi:UDP:flavonoid glycosyltransferase YjiC (YdhE family)
MSHFLIVTWDGAGNLVPTLGIAQGLVDAGHDVRLLGHRSIDERFGRHGWQFRPFSTAPEYDAVHPGDLTRETGFLVESVFFSGAIATDALAEIRRTPTDAVLVDALMPSALCAAEASGVPTAALFHTAYCLFRGGPLLEMVSAALPLLAAVRADLGLDPIAGIPELHDRCRLRLVTSPREFEPPGDVSPEVIFVGPVLDAPQPLTTEPVPTVGDGTAPLVLVSFSTSDMGQRAVLQRVVDGLAPLAARVLVTTGPSVDPSGLRVPANATVLGHVPHAAVLPKASIVVTHAGMGTVMASLAHGVPLVCMPMGRDQFFNAQRVAELSAGRIVATDADGPGIADTVTSVLEDPALRDGAKRMATDIAAYRGAAGAVAELERLASESEPPR